MLDLIVPKHAKISLGINHKFWSQAVLEGGANCLPRAGEHARGDIFDRWSLVLQTQVELMQARAATHAMNC